MKFYVRESEYIQNDIARGWSSWNFGQDGIRATAEQMERYISEITETSPLLISGFEISPDKIAEYKIAELYPNYWVVIDTRLGNICGTSFQADSLEDAKNKMSEVDIDFAEGEEIPCDAKLIYSSGNLHLFANPDY